MDREWDLELEEQPGSPVTTVACNLEAVSGLSVPQFPQPLAALPLFSQIPPIQCHGDVYVYKKLSR